MSDKQDLRRENLDYRRTCQRRLNKSPLPAAIKATLQLILDHMGSPSDYILSWVSHRALAESQGLCERTIEWHCKSIEESGLLEVQKLGLREARQLLKQEFGYTLKGVFAHRLTFYRINRNQPFWAGDDQAVNTIKEVLARRGGGDHAPGRPRHRPKALKPDARDGVRDTLNPEARDGLNPDARDVLKPEARDGQPFLRERTLRTVSDETLRTAAPNPLEPLKERTLPAPDEPEPAEERDRSSSETRDGGMTHSSPDSELPESLTGYIRNETVRDWVADMLPRLVYHNPNHFKDSSTDWEKTAGQIEALCFRLRTTRGRYPDSEEGYAALCSVEFRGLKRFSWGWLCSRNRNEEGNIVCNLDRWEAEIIRQMEMTDKARGTPAVQRNYALENLLEMKRANPDDPELDQLILEAQKMAYDSV
jgi:hypothetical protein